jgi:hypothetical protein
MADLTDEEYDVLEAFVTKYPPTVDPSKARCVVRKTPADSSSGREAESPALVS